jgi:hypothetical protein
MEHTISMRIRRMREVLHIVDDAMLEAFTVGQATTLPPVHEIPERRVQVQNVHFCVLHGWTAVVPLPPRHHQCRCLTWDRLHPLPWTSIWRHHCRLRRLQRQLLVVHHHRRRPWSSGPLPLAVDSHLATSTPRVDVSSSLAIAQMGWPHIPSPMGGPNGPRSGPWRLPSRRPLGGGGWGSGGGILPRLARGCSWSARQGCARRGAPLWCGVEGMQRICVIGPDPTMARLPGSAAAPNAGVRPLAVGRGGAGPTLHARSPGSGGGGPDVGTARPGRRDQSCPRCRRGRTSRPRAAPIRRARRDLHVAARRGCHQAQAREKAPVRARTWCSARARGSPRLGHKLGAGKGCPLAAATGSFGLPGGGWDSPWWRRRLQGWLGLKTLAALR